MNLTDLLPEERVVLLGLVHHLVQADFDRTDDEMREFREIAKELGRKEFDAALHEALRVFADFEGVLVAAASVTRPGAREIIYTVLVDLASSDDIVEAERAVLDQVATLWGVGGRR